MTAILPIRPSAAPARALRGPAALLLTGLTLLTSCLRCAPALRHDRQRCLERCRGRPARPAAHSLRPAAGSGRNPAPHALHRRHLDRRLLDLAEPVGLGARPLGQCPASGLYLDASLLCPSWQWRRVRQWSLDCAWPPLRAARPLYPPACGSGPRQRTSVGSHRPSRPHSAGWQPHGLDACHAGPYSACSFPGGPARHSCSSRCPTSCLDVTAPAHLAELSGGRAAPHGSPGTACGTCPHVPARSPSYPAATAAAPQQPAPGASRISRFPE